MKIFSFLFYIIAFTNSTVADGGLFNIFNLEKATYSNFFRRSWFKFIKYYSLKCLIKSKPEEISPVSQMPMALAKLKYCIKMRKDIAGCSENKTSETSSKFDMF